MANGRDKRRLAAILAADVVGCSGLIDDTQRVGVGRGTFAVIGVSVASGVRRTLAAPKLKQQRYPSHHAIWRQTQ